MKKCPHADVKFCPLYIAAHSTGHGCDDGRLAEGGCAVSRGKSYQRELELIRVNLKGLAELAAWNEQLQARQEQRQRNLRLNGIQ